jgi:hypothetical protein
MRACLLSLVLSCGLAAHAQTIDWTHELDAFTVAIPVNWRQAEGRIPVSGEKLLVIQSAAMIAHVPAPRTFFAQECSIGRTLHPEMREGQAELNAMLEDGRLLQFLVGMAFPSREYSRGNELVQGIRVISYDVEVDVSRGPLAALSRAMQPDVQVPEVGPYRLMMRMFQLAEAEGAVQYILVCQSYPTANAEAEIDEMKDFLASLSFNP